MTKLKNKVYLITLLILGLGLLIILFIALKGEINKLDSINYDDETVSKETYYTVTFEITLTAKW